MECLSQCSPLLFAARFWGNAVVRSNLRMAWRLFLGICIACVQNAIAEVTITSESHPEGWVLSIWVYL